MATNPRKPVTNRRKHPREPGHDTKQAISRLIGISASTLQVHLGKPGAPKPNRVGHYPIEATKQWVEQNADWAAIGSNLRQMRERKLEMELESKKFEFELRKGKFIAKEDVERSLIPLVQEIDELYRQKFELVLPSQYQGKNVIECQQLNAAARDEIALRFKSGSRAAVENLVDTAREVAK
jgi:hypothetical protein